MDYNIISYNKLLKQISELYSQPIYLYLYEITEFNRYKN